LILLFATLCRSGKALVESLCLLSYGSKDKINKGEMTICLIATICKEGGALSIYNQMMGHLLCERKSGNEYIAFIDPAMPTPIIEGVRYIKYSTAGARRLLFDYFDFKRICKERKIAPDVIFSLNNTGERCGRVRQIVYYHQSLPLYKYTFSVFNSNDRGIVAFKLYFPFFVKQSLKWTDTLVVQTDIIKELFSVRFNYPLLRIKTAFPDIENVDTVSVCPYVFEEDYYNFLYPAIVVGYKEHTTIALALDSIKNFSILNKLKIHLTIKEGEHLKLQKIIKSAGLEKNFVFHGPIPHEQLLSMYKAADGLLFPSTIETIGLPLLEAAAFGLPVLANDLDYVKDVLKGYNGLTTVPLRDYKAWGEEIVRFCIDKTRYNSYQRAGGSDWPKIFKLIHGE